MSSKMELLECPMCPFTVLPKDDSILQLHFEQVHTTDSPFIIKDDPEPLPPSLPPRPSSNPQHAEDTTSSDDSDHEESSMVCPKTNCAEVVPFSDFNDHLDYHNAETLSFDETTGKYISHHSSHNMHSSTSTRRSRTSRTKAASVEHNLDTDSSEAQKATKSHERKAKKHSHRHRRDTDDSEKSTIGRSIMGFNPFTKSDKTVKPPVKSARLGKSELGPYAWEKRMPRWLHDQLDAGPKIINVNRIGRDGRLIKHEQVQNETPGIIPILAQLSALDRTVKDAYYCHPSTLHVGKTPNEGGFCGYRNIHMLLSYIQGAKAQGYEEFPGRLPSILKMQNHIEDAWDHGINQIGRIQTGGIRDTRKYIGTPEAQAFFLNAEINCAVEQFSDNKETGTPAHEALLAAMERYFTRAAVNDGSNVHKTLLPPIYLQQPGHSTTIIGFERHYDGNCNLVVFDPMYSTSPAMHKLLGRKNIKSARPEVLYAYRRGAGKLKKHAAFEILMLTATPPLFPAWDVLRQFPDCRFVYVFFRARTLGYDVYPEDVFLQTFPWQQYGGLWSCDDSRFARSERMNTFTALALRRITSEGSSVGSNSSNYSTSPTSVFTNSSFQHMPSAEYDRLPSWIGAFDGTTNGFHSTPQCTGSGPVFNMGAPNNALPLPSATKPHLSLLTDVGRKYPGFPTPLSPAMNAEEPYLSPSYGPGSGHMTPRAITPAGRTATPMSIDGSEMCGPSRRCESHGYSHFASQLGLIDNIVSRKPLHSTPRTPSASSRNITGLASPPTSPSHHMSPRTAMLNKLAVKHGLPELSPTSVTDPGPGLDHPNSRNINAYPASPPYSIRSFSSTAPHSPPAPSIHIANGVESEATSPIDPSGTMLFYTSNRSVDSGLLGVPPLSEPQVAEYRFWRPCGRRVCGFGCGTANVGEAAAAKRLFRDVEEVVLKDDEQSEDGSVGAYGYGLDGQVEQSSSEGSAEHVTSTWAGRRLVTDWNQFLSGCEREGVAPF
ncbi:Peptidase-C78 domain-containing protein [Pyrenophora tritici-repentis]|nr:Peptidase-C78 domain-containing protein [Pyrenophora tritici-repentis]KAI0621982.1 Peptidase-C78 domain-containing protein [Pyrenophora tritici-repentis]